ncbi:MAG: trypsin-like peptidase domain-containing protein [Oscillospiraceae bacterium]|nr:trypsin-like peptidase domain-containing protein [Oscillospiraceae bacterium]
MEDYKDMYPRQDAEQKSSDPYENPDTSFSSQPEQSAPPQEEPQPDAPTFFGDPQEDAGRTPDYGWQLPPVVPQEPTVSMNRRIYTMCAVIAVLIFLLCLYCIGSDILNGALGTAQNPVVEFQLQEKPDLDPKDDDVTADGEYTVRGVAEHVTPSVVQVYTFSGNDEASLNLEGTGSGIIISEDGYIVTNAHVVQGDSFKVKMNSEDKEGIDARLVGKDVKTDLAVLKIEAKSLTPAVLGDSDQTYVGENVIAIGSPAGLTNTVTKGIVSAIGRKVRAEQSSFRMECIQTDAAISPSNSGGALVNMYGQVIGITSSKYASLYASAYEGLGFAITINQALPVVQELIENGYVSGRVRIGITFTASGSEAAQLEFREKYKKDMPDELKNSVWISEVSEECDIHNTQLKAGDFILSMQGKPVKEYDDILEATDGCKGDDTVKAHCARYENGRITYFDISFKLEEDRSGNF